MSTITVKDGTTIYYKDWEMARSSLFRTDGRLTPMHGTASCFSSPRMGSASLHTTAEAMVDPVKPELGNDMNGYPRQIALFPAVCQG